MARIAFWGRNDPMRLRRCTAALLAALSLGCGAALAQDYPAKPVRLMVGFAPGGIVDEVARYMADFITREMGQQAIVENRTGAAGTTAMSAVARAEPDGYTLGVAISGSLVISPFVQKQMPLDVMKDLSHVASLVEAPQFIAINASLPAKTAQAFIALAKSKPDGFDYGSAGMGSLPHLSAAIFAHQAGLKMVHVPYRGAQPAVADLMAGRLAMIASSVGDLRAGMDAGQIRVLLAASKERQPYLPDVPAAPEVGLPDYLVSTWLGVVVSSATPRPVVDAIHAMVGRFLDDPATRKRLETRNIGVLKMTQPQFGDFVKQEYARWGAHVKTVGVEPE